MDTASFIPIAPEQLQWGIDSWEAYLNDKTLPDPLVQLAILHLEFEALHPFRDGNGRLGRMLIPLFLYYRGLLSSPNFYMSGYLESRRETYLETMRSVSLKGTWPRWIKFFLQGVVEQAKENERKARSILNLYNRVKEQIVDLTHSQHAIKALDFLFRHPVFSVSSFIKNSDIPKASATRIIRVLRDNQMLKTGREGSGRRSNIYLFAELLMVAEGDHNVEPHP